MALQAKREEDLFDVAPHCAAMMNQYARIGTETIARMQKCEVIARYGVGVDIVDVGTATDKGILVTNVQNYCTEEVADHAIALWTRAITPRGTHTMFSRRKVEPSINVPISCGGVVVNPGDFIVADLMGVVVIPQELAEETVRLAQEQADREEETRKWVAQGKTVEDLLNEFGRI